MAHRSVHCPELPATPGRILIVAGLALVAGVVASWWIDRPPGPECPGFLVVRSTVIRAPSQGQVATLAVAEGTAVRMGEPILTLHENRLQTQISEQQRLIRDLESELARKEAEADLELKWRLSTLEAEICEIQLRSAGYLKEKYDFDLQRTMLSESLTDRQLSENEPGVAGLRPVALEAESSPPRRIATVVQMEAAANASEVSAAQLEICQERESRLTSLKSDLPTQVRKMLGVDVAQSRLSAAVGDLDQLQAQESQLTITSPGIGRVGVYQVAAGDLLNAGDPIVELLDDSKRSLIVHVPSQSITRFAVGTKVSLVFPGNVTRAGEVTHIAPQTGRTQQFTSDATVQVEVEARQAAWPQVPFGTLVKVRPAR